MDYLQKAKEEMAACEQRWKQNVMDYPSLSVVEVYTAIATAEALVHIATHLGNIHQALITPNADGEPVGVGDLTQYIIDHLEARGR